MRLVVSKFVQLIIVLILVSFVTFALLTALPGSAADVRIGPLPNFSPTQRAQIVASLSHQLGLDKPWIVQFLIWLKDAATGNFGTDLQGSAVGHVVAGRIGPTVELGAVSVVAAIFISTTLAIWAFRTRFGTLRGAVHAVMTVLLVIPAFWLGLLLILGLATELTVFPASGFTALGDNASENMAHLVLPAATLAFPQAALYFRYLSAGLDEAAAQPFVIAARARGVSERGVVYRHVLPNGTLPTITIIGIVIGSLMSGLVIVESLFSWPGLGSLLVQSVNNKDYNTLAAIVLLVAVTYVVIAFVVDIVYYIVDPRTRRSA